MAAMAGALGVRLEKPGQYTLGEGPLPGVTAIDAGVRVMRGAALLGAVALTGISLGWPSGIVRLVSWLNHIR